MLRHPAHFVLGAVNPSQYPEEDRPEIAFGGRSNVGKSSLLNRLLNQKALARVSRTPGCTRQVQFYDVGGVWWFVDLPGYGFAKAPLSERKHWGERMERYFSCRRNLRAVVLLLDLRREFTDLDREMVNFLEARAIPFLPVGTKRDKLAGNEGREAIRRLDRILATQTRFAVGPLLPVSSHTGIGMEELAARITSLLE